MEEGGLKTYLRRAQSVDTDPAVLGSPSCSSLGTTELLFIFPTRSLPYSPTPVSTRPISLSLSCTRTIICSSQIRYGSPISRSPVLLSRFFSSTCRLLRVKVLIGIQWIHLSRSCSILLGDIHYSAARGFLGFSARFTCWYYNSIQAMDSRCGQQ